MQQLGDRVLIAGRGLLEDVQLSRHGDFLPNGCRKPKVPILPRRPLKMNRRPPSTSGTPKNRVTRPDSCRWLIGTAARSAHAARDWKDLSEERPCGSWQGCDGES